ncbi:MAG: hypothetical protein QGH93_03065 [Gammaproteobacteria bacterium]|nr:hypothetical protein [Gammaproteobacteria bacterium]
MTALITIDSGKALVQVAAVQEALEDLGLDGASDQAGGCQFVMMTGDTLKEGAGARVARAIKTPGRWLRCRIGLRHGGQDKRSA